MPRGLAPGGVDEPKVRPVREQADRDLGFAQEPLEPRLGAGLPAVVLAIGLWRVIEVEAELDPLDEHEPLRGVASCWLLVARELWDGVGRAKGLVVLGESRPRVSREQTRPRAVPTKSAGSQPRICVAKRGKSRIAG